MKKINETPVLAGHEHVSPKQSRLDEKLMDLALPQSKALMEYMLSDPETAALQNYANTVSIKRLGFNDHGPVHMRMCALYALRGFNLLKQSDIKLSLEREGVGTAVDSFNAVFLAAFLHDVGMSLTRDDHERFSVILAKPIVERVLEKFYPDDFEKRIVIRSLVLEGIAGHMGRLKIHSLEAGLVLLGDGCDMEKGRARIPILITENARPGDIHKFSSQEIKKVELLTGEKLPLRIEVIMRQSVGFFQVEEVLIPKILSSPVKPYVELLAGVEGEEMRRYF